MNKRGLEEDLGQATVAKGGIKMEKYSQFRDRGMFKTTGITWSILLIPSNRIWDRTILRSLLTIPGNIPTPPHLPLQHQASTALRSCNYLLSISTMVSARVIVQESSVMDDSGNPWNMVDRSADRRSEEGFSRAEA